MWCCLKKRSGMTIRRKLFFIGLGVIFALFVARLLYLQLYRYDFFKTKSENQLKRIINLYPNRGTILDTHLNPLALTQPSLTCRAIHTNGDELLYNLSEISFASTFNKGAIVFAKTHLFSIDCGTA